MDFLHFSENLVRLRREKKLTQEQLADFIGVTKAAISKWETKQSLPDLLILPKLSSFFDISIDALLGYQPQLSREEIRRIYHTLAGDFSERPFDDVMEESRKLVKKYYSCYRFLLQIAILWINHFMLAQDKINQQKILTDASDRCHRIISDCGETGLCNDALCLKASICLLQNAPAQTIEIMKDLADPCSMLSQADSILIKAYWAAGRKDEADSFVQISTFLHLISLVDHAASHLAIRGDDPAFCRETISRTKKLIDIYRLDALHPGSVIAFELQAAMTYAQNGSTKDALEMLLRYTDHLKYLMEDEYLKLHGDSYFTRLEPWFEQLDLGSSAPRDKKVIMESAVCILDHPAFQNLQDEPEYQKARKLITMIGGSYE